MNPMIYSSIPVHLLCPEVSPDRAWSATEEEREGERDEREGEEKIGEENGVAWR